MHRDMSLMSKERYTGRGDQELHPFIRWLLIVLNNEQTKRIFRYIIKLLGVLLISLVGGFSYLEAIGIYRLWTLDSRVANHFYSPSADEVAMYEKDMVERPELEQQLHALFHNNKNYGLVWGENGVGKTSAVVQMIHEKIRPAGIPVFYVLAEEGNFISKLSTALGFDVYSDIPQTLVGILKMTYPEPSTKFLLDTLGRAAQMMKEKSGNRPVLVIDACNHLEATSKGSEFLRAVQNWAKVQADMNGMNVIFVSSEGKAPRTLAGRGVSSRMSRVRVTEASDKEARRYLELRRGVYDPKEQDRKLAIAGGVFKYLGRVDLGDVSSEITEILRRHGFSLKKPDFYSVTRTILEKGSIPYDDFMHAFGGDESDKAKELAQSNVFFVDGFSVTFQNRATRNFIAKEFAEEQKKREEEEQKKWFWQR